eukprot:SAG31_NODE_797_length_12029_cov_13.875692_6_plen_84_part_00
MATALVSVLSQHIRVQAKGGDCSPLSLLIGLHFQLSSVHPGGLLFFPCAVHHNHWRWRCITTGWRPLTNERAVLSRLRLLTGR